MDEELQRRIPQLPKLVRGAAAQPQTQPVRLSIPDYTREEALSYIGGWGAAAACMCGQVQPGPGLALIAPFSLHPDLHRAAGWSNLPSLRDNAPLWHDVELATRLGPRRLTRYLAHR